MVSYCMPIMQMASNSGISTIITANSLVTSDVVAMDANESGWLQRLAILCHLKLAMARY